MATRGLVIRMTAVATLSGLSVLSGCSPKAAYVGTWSSDPATSATSDFQFGGITLSGDGTYTAYASYAGTTRGFSGDWSTDVVDGVNKLVFESPRPGGAPLRYAAEQADDGTLVVTEPDSGIQTVLRQR